MRLPLIAAFVALLVADWWIASILFDAMFHNDCVEPGCTGDAVYWIQVAGLAAVLFSACWGAWRVWNRLRADFRQSS